ncbi:MAG: phage holin family protein [Ginsengibacter sp.]|jgi:ABC-type uncharacterized transport system fused permease/ATPase subunit
MESRTNIEDLVEKFKDYLETRIDLFRLKGIRKVSRIASTLVTSIILLIIFFIIILCLSIGLSLYLGDVLGKSYYGFFIVGGVYFIIGLIIYYTRNKCITTPISDRLIKELMD